MQFQYFLDLYFPPEWLKAALVLALLSTWVLVGLYAYLNRYTRRPYFALWTAGWLFYALWLTSSISFLEVNNPPQWEWVKLACIGICAIFLFWGALNFRGSHRGQREMALTVLMMLLWSYVARHSVESRFWLSMPLFTILSLSSFLTAGCFFSQRLIHRYLGASLLGLGFIIWGIQMAFQPFFEADDAMRPTGFVIISITQLLIAVGMIILMLEEVRGEAISLRDQIKADARLTRHLQKEIELTENKYEHLFQNTSDGIFVVDPRSLQILEVNRAAQALSGYSRDELLQLRFVNLCPILREKEREIGEHPEALSRIFASYGNIPLTRKDHNMLLTEGSASVMAAPKGAAVQVHLREVTERRRLEQQMRQVEKLSALGQLISGVAHELNNPLAVISGYAQLLSMRPTADEKIRGDLAKIQRESERASKIVQNFLTFARKHPMEKSNVNLNELVDVTLELLDYDLRASGVKLVRELQTPLPPVFGDPNQLEQVLLNLINNAMHAMEGSPREKFIRIKTEASGALVRLIVLDHGHGIPPAILEKVFDPFFTTKETGAGTGLGLSISHGIIKEHSGNITAANHDEDGAVFTLEFPVSHVKPEDRKAASSPMRKSGVIPPTRVFEVLVVDDEVAILDVFSELLADKSCRVHGATNGLQAQKMIERQDFDLIVSDLKMPGMDGRGLYEWVKETKPDLVARFIFVTGDTNSPRTLEFLQQSGNRWMTKPFNFREVESIFKEHFRRFAMEQGRADAPAAPSPR
ncbi:MAG: response regulator [Verrucomicrobiae bacterium]|nr:response regulator [Verrucomicrobiae bacterium]